MSDTDPWRFQRWAFGIKTGSPARKAVLMALATMADATTGRCEAKQETLAEWVEVTDRSVRTHLRALEAAGLVARRPQFRRDRGRRGDEFLVLAPWVGAWPDGQAIASVQPEESSTPPGSEGYSPPSIETSGQELPLKNDLPSTLNAPVRERASVETASTDAQRRVLDSLRAVADGKGATLNDQWALGACQDFPGRDYIGEAENFQAWWLAGKGSGQTMRDVNRTWRNWLNRSRPDRTQVARGRHLAVAVPEQTWQVAVAAVVALGRLRSTTEDNAAAYLERAGHTEAAEWVSRVGWPAALESARNGRAEGWAA